MSNRFLSVIRGIAPLLSLIVFVLPANAASFDCAKAATKVEKLICGDAQLSDMDTQFKSAFGDEYITILSKLDDEVAKTYQDDLKKANEAQKQQLLTEQKHWLNHTRNVCSDMTCLKVAYWSRQAGLATFFEPKAPFYEHEAAKADAIKRVLSTAPLYYHAGTNAAMNQFCGQMFDDLKHMNGIRFIDPIVQTQSYEDPALDKLKQHCGAKPPLHLTIACLPGIQDNLSSGKKGFEESLLMCEAGFGLPPFKLYELPAITQADQARAILYADDSYGPMNQALKVPMLGGGYSAGFQQVDPNKCEQVNRDKTSMGVAMDAGISTDYGQFKRNRENYNSIIEYKNQYYFLVINNKDSAWWVNTETVTPFAAKNQKSCFWTAVVPEKSKSSQSSKGGK